MVAPCTMFAEVLYFSVTSSPFIDSWIYPKQVWACPTHVWRWPVWVSWSVSLTASPTLSYFKRLPFCLETSCLPSIDGGFVVRLVFRGHWTKFIKRHCCFSKIGEKNQLLWKSSSIIWPAIVFATASDWSCFFGSHVCFAFPAEWMILLKSLSQLEKKNQHKVKGWAHRVWE